MKIGGLQKVSLIDYPGKIAAVIFTQGCNLRCPICHNPELIDKAQTETDSWDNVYSYLKSRVHHLDGVVITGGEPLLQENIYEAIQDIREMGHAVKVDTNGTFPEHLKKLIKDGLLHYIAMDVKASESKYSIAVGSQVSFDKIRKSIQYIMNSNLQYEFRTTLIPDLHDEEEITKLCTLIDGADQYYLQNLSGYRTLNASMTNCKTFHDSEMKNFQKIANQFVKNCQLRNV